MRVGSAGNDLDPAVGQDRRQFRSIGLDLAGKVPELRLQRFAKADRLGGDDLGVITSPSCTARSRSTPTSSESGVVSVHFCTNLVRTLSAGVAAGPGACSQVRDVCPAH